MSDLYASIRTPLFFLQTMVAVGLFGFPLKKRSYSWIRIPLVLVCGSILSYFDAEYFYFPSGGMEYSLPRFICMLVLYILLIIATFVIYKVNWFTAMFTASAGYAAQSVAGSLKAIIKLMPAGVGFGGTTLYDVTLDIICYGFCYLILFMVFEQSIRNDRENYDNRIKAIFSIIIMLLFIGMSRITQDNLERNMISRLAENIYGILSGIMILQIQFGLLENSTLIRNVDTMKELMRQQELQYQTSRESAELVNEKYHDLKQMINSICGNVSTDQLQKLQNSVEEYGAYASTGNKVLDILLTEKTLQCSKQQISITCISGGVNLDFIEELDQYSLFSNALTNAIEAVTKLPLGQTRSVTLTLSERAGMVFVHVENPCIGDVTFENGLPRSRRDSRYHGFGMRSMERVVEKYHGSLSTCLEGDIFSLDAVLMR